MSETTSTAKPAIAVDARGEHRRAGRRVGALERLARARRRRRAPGGSAPTSSTLNSVEIAITSAPSVDRHRVERPSGRQSQHEQHERRPARGERDRDQRHPRALAQPSGRRASSTRTTAGQRRPAASRAAAQRRGQRGVGLGRQHGQARPRGASRPAAGSSRASHVVDHVLLAVERHQPDAERERGGLAVARDRRACEK